MWFVVIALVSTVSSLMFGRVLAKAAAQETFDPRRVRGPSLESSIESKRLAIAKFVTESVHLN
jgi:hypothetical protein